MRLLLKNVRIAFPALYVPQAIGDGEPAYSAKFIVPPDHPQLKELRDAISAVAKEKWADKAEGVLKLLKEDKKVAFLEGPYRNKKTGEVYDGFDGNYTLSVRNGGASPVRPSTFDAQNREVTQADGVIYNGCYVDASIELYAQDNNYGRRINCSLRGVRFAGHGESFGGGTKASADEFGAPVEVEEDFV